MTNYLLSKPQKKLKKNINFKEFFVLKMFSNGKFKINKNSNGIKKKGKSFLIRKLLVNILSLNLVYFFVIILLLKFDFFSFSLCHHFFFFDCLFFKRKKKMLYIYIMFVVFSFIDFFVFQVSSFFLNLN